MSVTAEEYRELCSCGRSLLMENIDENSPDESVDWYIEQNRQSYYRDFFEYLQENGDGFFVF